MHIEIKKGETITIGHEKYFIILNTENNQPKIEVRTEKGKFWDNKETKK